MLELSLVAGLAVSVVLETIFVVGLEVCASLVLVLEAKDNVGVVDGFSAESEFVFGAVSVELLEFGVRVAPM